MENISDKINKIRAAFEPLGVTLSDEQSQKYLRYLDMILQWNTKVNLTAITDFDDMVCKHLVDSCAPALYQDILGPAGQKLVDVGSGAGFPGIPLKILRPELNVTMMDSLGKRVNFLQEVIRELELKDAEAVHIRAEDAGQASQYREIFDLCVSRAVSGLPVLSEYCLPLVRTGGSFVAYKTESAGQEAQDAANAVKLLGGRLSEIRSFKLPDTEYGRSLVIIKKIGKTPAQYPRKAGTALKKPL